MGLALCAGMTALTSCNDEVANEGGGGNNEPGNETTETGYFSINLSGGIMTRANLGTNVGTDSERKIGDVWVGLYDDMNETLEYSFHIDATNGNLGSDAFQGTDVVNDPYSSANPNNGVTPPSNANFTMTAKKVQKKPYKMVVLANYSKVIDPRVLEEGMNLEDLTLSMNKTVDELTSFTPNNPTTRDCIFMSNARGIVPVTVDDIDPQPEIAEQKAVPVTIDRAVAKINVVFPLQTGVIVEGGTIANAQWNVDIINRYLYPIRGQTDASDGNRGIVPETPARTAPYMETSRYNLYAEDPNFENVSIQLNPMLPPNGLDYNFIRITSSDITKHIDQRDPLSPADIPYDFYTHVTENTMKAEEQWEDVTTRVVVKLNYIPTGMTQDESYFYYSVNKRFYTLSKIQTGDLSTLPSSLVALLEDIQGDPQYQIDGYPGTPSWTYRGLTYYSQGISYYSILIRHFDEIQQPVFMQYGRYGVVRNNVYNITIRSIKKPGSIDIPEPEGPDDKEGYEEYISADITVQPWYVRGQESDL